MACEFEFEKLDEKIGFFTIHSDINANSEEACNNISNTMSQLETDGYIKYIFDLEDLSLANSRFIGLMANRHCNLSQKGGGITILNARKMVYNAFEMLALTDTLHFYSDKEEAINSFRE